MAKLISSDLYRYSGKGLCFRSFLKAYFMIPGFQYSVWMRLVSYLEGEGLAKRLIYPLAWYIWANRKLRFGINIPFRANVGPGLYIGHFGGIIVHPDCKIGRNCNVSQGVTIGVAFRNDKEGCPQIGDNVYIGSGAVIIGDIKVGNNSAIGANSVVTKDVPDNAVVAGVPAKIISYKGAERFIANTDYPAVE